MAYGQPPYPQQNPMPGPGPKPRPGTVTLAVWIQFLTAISLVITALGGFTASGPIEEQAWEDIQSDPSFDASGLTRDDISTLVTVMFAGVAAIFILFAVFYLVLGLLNNKGKRPARILSWILSGLALACCGLPLLVSMVGSATVNLGDTEYEDATTQAVQDATPGWMIASQWITLLLLLVGSLVIIIVLAMPPSNDFFRKEEPQPPYPGGPGQPPYPGGPGQPPYPGQQPPPGPGQPPSPPQ
ncbi:hypothetical protein [Glycomyces salinus]|uniref:hypothetical protein n=1 Tax=Glycomyces salinus TaxID=980294 RepID=UPI0018ED5443|nr:hypothetical protein [Glycomyces salinus]